MFDRFSINATQLTGMLSFAAATIACLIALRRSKWPDARTWTLLALANCIFVVEIFIGLRHRIHDLADSLLMARGLYDERQEPQEIITIWFGIIATFFVILPLFLRRVGEVDVRLAASITIALFALFAIETVSLHATDAVLYRSIGPVYTIGWIWAAAAVGICLATRWR